VDRPPSIPARYRPHLPSTLPGHLLVVIHLELALSQANHLTTLFETKLYPYSLSLSLNGKDHFLLMQHQIMYPLINYFRVFKHHRLLALYIRILDPLDRGEARLCLPRMDTTLKFPFLGTVLIIRLWLHNLALCCPRLNSTLARHPQRRECRVLRVPQLKSRFQRVLLRPRLQLK
jgi:hypothetical protein